MKILKSFSFLIAVSVSLLSFCVPVSAQSVSESEMEQVNQALEEYEEFWNDPEIYGEMPEVKGRSNNILDNVYKSYILNSLIIDEYEGDFGSLISDETRIFAESGNQLVTLIEKDGKLKATGSMILNDGEELINFENEAEKIRVQLEEEISDMKFVKSYLLGFDMIYCKTKNDEFVVPYFDNMPESFYSTIENDTIYTADEFVGRLNCVLDLSNYDPNGYGGIPFREVALEYSGNNAVSDSNGLSSNTYVIIIVSGLAALSLIVFFSVKILNRKN